MVRLEQILSALRRERKKTLKRQAVFAFFL